MRGKLRKLAIVFMIMTILVNSIAVMNAHAEEKQTAKHYNVMLVIDGSGSLTMKNGTDVEGNRYDALKGFLAVLTNEGNKVGAIVFNHTPEMLLDTGLDELTSMEEKKVLSETIIDAGATGDTDIGSALWKALEELSGNLADPNLPSCIVLFSDGETDLGNETDTNASIVRKDEAVKEANRLGIPIHGICLNTNNSANTQEVKGIAENTGGIYSEIKNKEDLEDAFLKFYTFLYGEEMTGGEEVCPVEKKFKIPSQGVTEVNILLEALGDNHKITLIRPEGIAYSDSELKAVSMEAGKYDIIKVIKPEAGVWTLQIDGDPGTSIWIDWIYNTDLSAEIECDVEEAILNEELEIRGYLLSENKRVEDVAVYEEYAGTLILTNRSTGEENNYPMESVGNAFSANVKFAKYGTYDARIQLVCGDIIHTSDASTINIGNQPPYSSEDVIKQKLVLFPLKQAVATVDLAQYITDPEGDKLRYEVGKYSYEVDKVVLKDEVLEIDASGEKEGSVAVIATDSQGAVCEVTVVVTTFNLGVIILLVLLLILLVVSVIILLNQKKKKSVVYPHTITVESFDENTGMFSSPYPHMGIKYKKNLLAWQTIDCGISGEFIAYYDKGNKNPKLKFVSKQSFESEDGRITKEFKFVVGDDVKLFALSADEDSRMTRGIRVTVTESMEW